MLKKVLPTKAQADVDYLLHRKSVSSDKWARAVADAILDKSDGAADAWADLNSLIKENLDALHTATAGDGVPEAIQKEPMYPEIVRRVTELGEFANAQASLDTNWMAFYQMEDARGLDSLLLPDITEYTPFSEYAMKQEIENEAHGNYEEARLTTKRYGKAFIMTRRDLRNTPRRTINRFIQNIQIASMQRKATVAYTSLWDTGATAATFTNSIIETINVAHVALIRALQANEPIYPVTDATRSILLIAPENLAQVRAAMRTVAGIEAPNIIREYPVGIVQSFNSIVTQKISGTDSGILIVPGFRNIWAPFDNLLIERGRNARTDGEEVVAQEYYNQQTVQIQKYVVPFA